MDDTSPLGAAMPGPDLPTLNTLSWYWIAVGASIPALLGLLAAFPFWRAGQMTFGSIVGTGVIFASAIGLILREYVEMDRLVGQCLDAGFVCWPEPSAFTRCAVFAFIGLIQVFGVFTLGLMVDERVRRRSYAPEWR
jgi:hypothetical protein